MVGFGAIDRVGERGSSSLGTASVGLGLNVTEGEGSGSGLGLSGVVNGGVFSRSGFTWTASSDVFSGGSEEGPVVAGGEGYLDCS